VAPGPQPVAFYFEHDNVLGHIKNGNFFYTIGTRFHLCDALSYHPEGGGVNSQWGHWNFSLT
jgi:hypothetical protein